jgi:hypothetical protein
MAHRFKLGQAVRLSGSSRYRSSSEGVFEVIRQMPDRDGELQYRIKSTHEPHERVVKESELERA